MDHAAVYLTNTDAERVASMKTHSFSQAGKRGPVRGSVLIVTLIVCLGLVSMALVLGHTMLLAYRGSDDELAGRQADMAIEGAAQYAEAVMTNVQLPGEMPDPANYQAQAVPLGEANFWFIGEPQPTDTSNVPQFNLVDESSKLNLNTATETMLENLPGMTQDLAEAIVAWRSSSTSGSSAGTSSGSAASSSAVKGGPFESMEELAQVNGGTPMLTLYGSDTNLNHVLDPSESAAGSTSFSPGLLEYVTVFSRVPNTTPAGGKRVNVTAGGNALTQLLTTVLGEDRARTIVRAVGGGGGGGGPGGGGGGGGGAAAGGGGGVKSVLEFYEKSGMTADEFAQVSGSLTATSGAYSVGLINVNTASQTVLECVPGITPTTAAQIVSARSTTYSEPTATGTNTVAPNLAWVGDILGGSASAQAGPYLTAETYQVDADVAAVGRHGRGYRRTQFVIDNSTGTPVIVYRRNLAGLGWAMGTAERQALANQTGTPQGAAPQGAAAQGGMR